MDRSRHDYDHAKVHDWLTALRSAPREERGTVLRGMRAFLVGHFAGEEAKTGLLAYLRREGLVQQVDALECDHRQLVEALDRLLEAPDAAALETWIAALGAHEAREVELLQDVLITDVGTGD